MTLMGRFFLAALLTWVGPSFGQITYVTTGTGSANNSIAVILGATPAVGDLLIAHAATNVTGQTITPSGTGWSTLRTDFAASGCTVGTTCAIKSNVFFKFHASGDPATYTFTVSGSGSRKITVGISVYRGVDASAPFLAHGATPSAAASATVNAPSLSPTSAPINSMLVALFAVATEATWPALPATYTSRYTLTNPGGGAGHPSFAAVTRGPLAVAETPAAQTATASAATAVNVGVHLALRPAVVIVTPGSFNAFETGTAAGAIAGVIRTKVAGGAFSFDVVSISGGAQQAAFNDQVIVELLGNTNLGVSLDANNCPITFTVVQTISPNPAITGGRSTVTAAAVPDAWRDVRVRVRWPTSSPTVTWCSTDNFAIRPSAFANFAVADTDWQTAGTGRALNLLTFAATTPTHKAGRPFSVRATALNAAAATTTNYADAPTATLSTCAGAACTATFGNLTLNTTFAAGQLTSDVASYDNVGSFRVELVDSSFASVDTADSSALEREIRSGTIDVGRFVPDHFAVSLNAPAFGTACGSFTYIGQAFNYTTAPVITVTAQDFANNTTTLYATIGSWWRITDASLTGKSYTAAIGALDTSGLPGTDPAIFAAGNGMGTLTFGSGSGLFFTRTTPTAPASPYDADISLAINVIDADGITLASNPARFGAATAGNGIAFSSGKSMRFGRLAIRNANGSQLVPLPVQVEAQYWLGAPTNAFVTNAADSCTVIAANNDAMSNFTSNLSGSPTCETAISGGGALSAGRRTLQLAAPGSGNNGSVDLTVNLGAAASGTTCTTVGGAPVAATTANLPYLQGNWSGGAYDQNPSARAAFGVYSGAEEVVHIRENFQ